MRENGAATRDGIPDSGRWTGAVLRVADRLLLRSLHKALREPAAGCLHLQLPSGEHAVFGRTGEALHARITVNRYRALWKLLRGGSLGFAESYMSDDLVTPDLGALFEFYVANEPALASALPSIEVTPKRDRLWHSSRRNTRDGSRRNIAAHYDIGNAFYRLWLDRDMFYSSGIFRTADASLEDAQAAKLDRVITSLELEAGQHVLEVGCGWGALAAAIAGCGARVDAITISREQLAEASDRVCRAGHGDRVALRLEDYRDTVQAYDRLVSIEMIEAVGEENWPLYFQVIADRLKPGGVAVIQAITIRQDAFERYRQNPDFIQRYIFPGGMLPTVSLMQKRATAAGLTFDTVETFGGSYSLTLQHWRRRFEAAWPQIEALGFDERFRRMWLYYLHYCEVGFAHGMIDVGLYRMRKPVAHQPAGGGLKGGVQ